MNGYIHDQVTTQVTHSSLFYSYYVFGEVASAAETRKLLKYQHLDCHFAPIAIETMGTYGSRTLTFLKELGRRMSRCLLERNSYVYLTQRLSVAVQRGNAASVLGTAVENYFVL